MSDSEKGTEPTSPVPSASQRAEDGKKAMAEYEMAAFAIRAKTERLRALRLARDAEAAKTAPKAAPKKKSASKSAAAKRASGTLSDWLDAQERGGHRA